MLDYNNGRGIKIAAIGDSITYGYPCAQEESWFNAAAVQCAIAYVNRGVNGDTTAGMLSRFARDVLQENATHVIIMGGTNDACFKIEASKVISNIQAMVQMALEKGIVPVIGLPIPCNVAGQEKLLGQYREKMRQYAGEHNIVAIDFHAALVKQGGVRIKTGLHCDAVHPNAAGYKVMTDVFTEFIRDKLL